MTRTHITALFALLLFIPFPTKGDFWIDPETGEDPRFPQVSNVLFLPGIKGSRLYQSETRLWEPSGNEDVRKLFLDENGKSVNADVHARAGDVLSEALSQEFYASFFNDLNVAETDDTYGQGWTWEAASYDWRLSLDDIVAHGARYDDRIFYNETNDMPYVEQLLRDLASSSVTGKVTIVAHSNGGLVAKALMERLGDTETTELVDKVVFVGVPQSGAPRALAAALFGYGEALPFDECATSVVRALCALLVDRETARAFAEHSPMTYHLLPSQPYFDATNDFGHPPAMFQGQQLYEKERDRYQTGLNTADELYDFVLAAEGGRTKPANGDLARANILLPGLVAYARAVHERLDAWTPPDGVEVHQIAGWGKSTFSGIQFYEEPRFLDLFGRPVPRYRPAFIEGGDGVVPVDSALMMRGADAVKRYWIDLTRESESHANLLEIEDVRTFVGSLLSGSVEMPSLISESVPDRPPARTILFVLHSPLTLGVVDSDGYTGLNEDGTVAQANSNVEYGRLGEVQYLLAPAGREYEVVLKGLATGTFSLDILEKVRDNVSTTTVIGNIPTAAGAVATLTVPAITGNISDLEVDINGDGTIDLSVTPKLGETVVLESAAPSAPPSEPATTTHPTTSGPTPSSEPGTDSGSSRSQSRSSSSTDTAPLPSFTSVSTTEISATSTSGELAAEENPLATTSDTVVLAETPPANAPTARTQTASAYDAYGSAVNVLAKRALLMLGIVFLLTLLIWRILRAKKKK